MRLGEAMTDVDRLISSERVGVSSTTLALTLSTSSEETHVMATDDPTLFDWAEQQVEYRDLPGYPGYRIGSDGSVWSCWTTGCKPKMTSVWRKLKTPNDNHGRPQVNVRSVCPETGQRASRHVHVHTLVLEAFVGPCPPGLECCHEDGVRTNNTLRNLRWDTRPANRQDSIRHGTFLRGSMSPVAKLTEEDIPAIRFLRRLGWTYPEIAAVFGVAEGTIASVLRGKSWCHA
jgi:hypothetical protein